MEELSRFCSITVYLFLYSTDTQTGTLGRTSSNHNIFWKQKILKFFCKGTHKIHKFEGCFLRGQVSSNAFKVFNGHIVELWILSVCLQKTLKIFGFRKGCDWTISFQVSHLSVCTVIIRHNFVPEINRPVDLQSLLLCFVLVKTMTILRRFALFSCWK